METTFYLISINFLECTKFRGLHSIVGLVPSCLRGYFVCLKFFLVGIFHGSKNVSLSSWVFHGSKNFLVGILWVQNFFWWLFRESEIVFRGYSVGPIFFLVANFVIQRFSIASWTRKSDTKQKYINTSQTAYSSANRFQQLSVVYIRKVLHLLDYLCYYSAFIRSNCVFSHLFSTVLDLFTWNSKRYLPYYFTDYSGSWLLILRIPLLEKNVSSFFYFGPIRPQKTVTFRGSEHSTNSQLLGAMFTAWRSVVDVVLSQMKKDRWAKFSVFLSLLINKQQNQWAS